MIDGKELTLSVPEAGRRYFSIGKNLAYEAAHRGEIPVIRIGRKLRVPVAALERILAEAGMSAKAQSSTPTFGEVPGARKRP